MSSIARKNKRRAAFKCAKQGIAPAQEIAVSAAREIQATKAATTETMEVLLQAMALVAQFDYGKSYRGYLLVAARRKARHQVSNFVLHRKARKLKDMEG